MDQLNSFATSSAPSALKITDLRICEIDGVPKHCLLLKIMTNEGITGFGELRDASSATYALMLKSRILGENPCNVEKLFRRIRQFGGHSRQGGGVSGIEVALWDLVGKAYGVPCYQFLGGKYRDRVRIYCDTDVAGKHTGADMGRALKKRMEQGFTFLKMDLGIELLFDTPGTLSAPAGFLEDIKRYSAKAMYHQQGSIDPSLMRHKNYEVFTLPHHATGIHLTEKGLDLLEEYVRQVRDEIGNEIPLAVDHFGHVPVEDCIRFARRVEKYNLAWIEDVAPWHYTAHYEKIAHSTTVPICTGEDIYLHENFEPLLACGGVSVVHPDVLTIGGMQEAKKLSDLCDRYGVALALHMAESPVGCMAAVHCAAAMQNVLAAEFHSCDFPAWNDLAVGIANPLIQNGFIDVPETPGLGIEAWNEAMLQAYAKEGAPAPWADTSSWDNEWSNDRTWS